MRAIVFCQHEKPRSCEARLIRQRGRSSKVVVKQCFNVLKAEMGILRDGLSRVLGEMKRATVVDYAQ